MNPTPKMRKLGTGFRSLAVLAWVTGALVAATVLGQANEGAQTKASTNTVPSWRSRSLASIESARKALLTVEVVDEHGVAAPGARVTIRQLGHEFQWGAPPAAYAAGATPMFNTVWMGRPSSPGAAGLEDALQVAARSGTAVHATWQGSEAPSTQQPGWAGIVAWEFPPDMPATTRLGWIGGLRRASPFARLLWAGGELLGPGGQQGLSRLRREAIELARQGQGVDGISAVVRVGLGGGRPDEWLARLDEGAGTEGEGTPLTWHLVARLGGGGDPDVIAGRLAELLTVAFGHPAVTGVSWEPGDGADAGLVTRDGLTPAGMTWSNLVCTAWTSRADLRTSMAGRAEARLFRGEHEVSVEHAGARVTTRTRVAADTTTRLVVPVTRPVLSAEPGALVKFSWPAHANGFVLEWAEDAALGPWTRCETFAVRGRDVWRQEAGWSSRPRYFRLRRGEGRRD